MKLSVQPLERSTASTTPWDGAPSADCLSNSPPVTFETWSLQVKDKVPFIEFFRAGMPYEGWAKWIGETPHGQLPLHGYKDPTARDQCCLVLICLKDVDVKLPGNGAGSGGGGREVQGSTGVPEGRLETAFAGCTESNCGFGGLFRMVTTTVDGHLHPIGHAQAFRKALRRCLGSSLHCNLNREVRP